MSAHQRHQTICVALSSFFALELTGNCIFSIPKELNAQPLDIMIGGAKCEAAGRLKLLIAGKFDRLVYTTQDGVDSCFVVLPPVMMLRNYLPHLGIDILNIILELVGSPFVCYPPFTIETAHLGSLNLSYDDGYTWGDATYHIKYCQVLQKLPRTAVFF
jgi:hypothetical protein